jgi:MinD-like ATPase involved in chromosome partitioning or flagellar assembly
MSYAQDHAGIRVVGTVLSTREVLDLEYDLLLVDDTTSYLTKRLVDRVKAMNRIVIGVYEAARGEVGRHRLADMGVDGVIDADAPIKEFLARIRYVAEQRVVDHSFAEIIENPPGRHGAPTAVVPGSDEAGPVRSLVVVSGASGVTEVAVGLGAAMRQAGRPVVLVDLDTVEPTLAQRLGLELSPNVLTGIESLRHEGELGEVASAHQSGLRCVAGLPSPREWNTCAPDDAVDLVAELATVHANVVVKVDRQLEDLAPFGVHSGRFEMARRLVAVANQLVVVGDPSPTGVTALLSWIGDARALSGAPIHVVLNHCGRSLYQQGEIRDEIGRTFRSASVVFLPEDHRVRKAAWQGEVSISSRFVRALESVVDRLSTHASAEVRR